MVPAGPHIFQNSIGMSSAPTLLSFILLIVVPTSLYVTHGTGTYVGRTLVTGRWSNSTAETSLKYWCHCSTISEFVSSELPNLLPVGSYQCPLWPQFIHVLDGRWSGHHCFQLTVQIICDCWFGSNDSDFCCPFCKGVNNVVVGVSAVLPSLDIFIFPNVVIWTVLLHHQNQSASQFTSYSVSLAPKSRTAPLCTYSSKCTSEVSPSDCWAFY